jgi:hypothetical protein
LAVAGDNDDDDNDDDNDEVRRFVLLCLAAVGMIVNVGSVGISVVDAMSIVGDDDGSTTTESSSVGVVRSVRP